MIVDVINDDCNKVICSYLDISSIAKIMQLNKKYNKGAMGTLVETYKLPFNKITRKGRIMHMGKLLTPRNQGIAKEFLISGEEHSRAVLMMKCMLCGQKCPSISKYGFVAHSKCVKKKEQIVNGRTSPINLDMLPYTEGLRKRVLQSSSITQYAIKEEIPGVYPHELSLRGYIDINQKEIQEAREKAELDRQIRMEREERTRIAMEKHEEIIKKEIESLTGMSYDEWTWKEGEETYKIVTKKYKNGNGYAIVPFREGGSRLPPGFEIYVTRFKTGRECLHILDLFRRYPILCKNMPTILYVNWGQVIDNGLVEKKVMYYLRVESISKKMESIGRIFENPGDRWENEEYMFYYRMRGTLTV